MGVAPSVVATSNFFLVHLGISQICVEIKFWMPHAIDATSSPQLHLLDGV